MTKIDFWPKDGKLKKGLIVLAVIMVASLLIVLLEEKTQFKAGKKLTMIIAFACIGIWVYKPADKKEANNELK